MNLIFCYNYVKSFLVITAIICSTGSFVYSQDVQENLPLKDRLDYVFKRNCAKSGIVGVASNVMIKDESVWEGVYGISYDTIKIDTNSLFAIGSITKTFTAAIILQLYGEGLLNLHDSIGKYLPDYPHVPPSATILQVLNHTSGIYNFLDNPIVWDALKEDPDKVWTVEEVLGLIKEPYFLPGARGAYSNTGYVLLGKIIETITGNSIKAEMQSRIFDPLGLENTYFLPGDSIYQIMVHPWENNKDNYLFSSTVSNFSMFGAAGAIITTAREASELHNELFYKKTILCDTLLDVIFRNFISTGQGFNYSLGLEQNDFTRYDSLVPAYGNGGLMRFSWSARAAYIPEDSITISLCVNTWTDLVNFTKQLYTAIINLPPDDLYLSETTFDQAIGLGSRIGQFTSSDPNQHIRSTYTYTLVEGDGVNDKDNDCFTIDNNDYLIKNCDTDVLTQDDFTIRVRCDDSYGGLITKSFQLFIVKDVTPPTAAITYGDTENRCGDELLITATFDEPMLEANAVKISMSGGAVLTSEDMTRVSETVFTYTLTVPNSEGDVTLSLSNGTDLWSNEVVSAPTVGATFSIIPITYGDVDDDGTVFAHDADLTLQYSVDLDPLPTIDPIPWENWRDTTANVDGIGTVTANDAGMILQYSIGKITAFDASAKKSNNVADVTVEVVDTDIVFYSSGELIGLNVSAVNENQILSAPVIVAENFLSAKNIEGTTYKVGLCTSTPASESDVLMKIPFNENGSVTFDMVINAVEKSVTIDLATGVADFGLKGINIYPNPASDLLYIEGLQKETLGRIYNANGQLVLIGEVEAETGKLSVSGLPSGMYILKLMNNDEMVVKRFTKE